MKSSWLIAFALPWSFAYWQVSSSQDSPGAPAEEWTIDIHAGNVVHDLSAHRVRRITNGEGLNESPSWAPNGRHLVFTSTRAGEPKIFTMNRDGSNVRQLTFEGKNTTPSWGPVPR